MYNMNFYSHYLKANEKKSNKRRTIIALVTFFIAILSVGFATYQIKVMGYQDEIASAQAYLNNPKVIAVVKTSDDTSATLQELTALHEEMKFYDDAIVLGMKINKNLLTKISQSMPSNVYFTDMSFSDKRVTIRGYADDKESVAVFLHHLLALTEVESAEVPNISREERSDAKDRFSFSVLITLS